jgi:hypothetical protein
MEEKKLKEKDLFFTNFQKNIQKRFSYLLVVPAFPTPYSFSVTFFLPFGLRPFFILLQINTQKKGLVSIHNKQLIQNRDSISCGSRFISS